MRGMVVFICNSILSTFCRSCLYSFCPKRRCINGFFMPASPIGTEPYNKLLCYILIYTFSILILISWFLFLLSLLCVIVSLLIYACRKRGGDFCGVVGRRPRSSCMSTISWEKKASCSPTFQKLRCVLFPEE